MIYGSVCSGIEAATVAWHPLGWKPSFFSEIEAAPRSVLSHHYPNVPLHGDFTTIGANQYEPIDLLVGGTPCQSFSIAGLRGGLDDDRGNLALEFLRLAQRTRPKWLVWENVPGVLSSNGGRDFGSILGGLVECGYGFAYRVLDAQYFGVAQRRRRVFVVGYLGDWRPAAAVLFERHSLQGHSAPSREKREEVAGTLAARFGRSCNNHEECVAQTLTARTGGFDLETETPILQNWPAEVEAIVTGSLCARTGQSISVQDADQGHLVAWPAEVAPTLNAAFGSKLGLEDQHIRGGAGLFVNGKVPTHGGVFDVTPTLTSNGDAHSGFRDEHGLVPTAYSIMPMNSGKDYKARQTDVAQPLMAGGPVGGNQGGDFIAHQAVRRLTPRECERLQGFPDDYTLVPHRNKPMSDGPRYKALGNSMAVPVMRWIGERIQMVQKLKDVTE